MSIPGVLVFLAVVSLALVVLPGYIWWRLVRSTTQPGRIRRRLTVLTVVLAVLPLAADALNRVLPEEVATPLEWVAYSWLGVALYLVLVLLALEPVRLMLRLVQRRRAPAPGPAPALEPAEAVPSAAHAAARRDEAPAHREQGTDPDRGVAHEDRSIEAAGRRPEDDRVIDPSWRLFLARSLAATAWRHGPRHRRHRRAPRQRRPARPAHTDHLAGTRPRARRLPISSPSPTGTSRRPTAGDDSHGWSRSSTRRGPTSSRSSVTWWTERSTSCVKTWHRWPTGQ